jgi:glycogen operon protein
MLDVAPLSPAELHLAPGIYDTWADGDEGTRRKLIVSPGQCYLPEELRNGGRVFGLASHLYSLRHDGGSGIGDFETLRRFASLTSGIGGRYAGINPLHHLFPTDRSRASPYQPSDRNFVDPIYIDIGQLLTRFPLPKTARLAAQQRAGFASLDALPHVDYAAVWTAKSKLLEAAFAEFGGDPGFDSFLKHGGDRLAAHGRFEALRAGESATPSRISYRAFLQWIADMQLGEAARHWNLYCDLALGCAFDGGEISSEPDLFAESVSIGAPPDPFSRAGQVWNLPPFSPLALARDNLEPMRRVLSANMRHAAALRIDHVLGFARQFWVPQGAEGRDGAYVSFPLDALIAVTALESRRNRCLVVGEDLGTVPDGLRDALSAADILSYRVLWFEREGAGFRKPEDYPAKALTCLASHDLPTFFGWRAGRDIDISLMLKQIDPAQAASLRADRQQEVRLLETAANAMGADGTTASAAVHGMVASTPSKIMLIQADDLAGERDPLNVPGTDREWPNWRRRVSVDVDKLADSGLAQAILACVKEERPA